MNHRKPMTPAQAADDVLQLEYDFADILREDRGMHEREAYDIAQRLVQGLRKRYGGTRLGRRGLYIPAPSKAERDAQICREFDGTNADDVCERHGIKRSRLYQIVSRSTGKPMGQPAPKAPALAPAAMPVANSPVSSLEAGRAAR